MSYVPEEFLAYDVKPDELASFLLRELQKIKIEFDQNRIELSTAAPVVPEVGRIYLANGTSWNPGAGGGFYGYDGSLFIKLS